MGVLVFSVVYMLWVVYIYWDNIRPVAAEVGVVVLYLVLWVLGVVLITGFVLYFDTVLYEEAINAYVEGVNNRVRAVSSNGNSLFNWSMLTGHHRGLITRHEVPSISIDLYSRSYPITEKVW